MSRQLRLPLQREPSYRRDEFIVTPANAEAVRLLDGWRSWHGGVLALVGPEGSGKTHLARAWLERVQGLEVDQTLSPEVFASLSGRPLLLENADRNDPELLFHLINLAAEGGALLLTARSTPSTWAATLPDLRSRLNALPVAELGPPDDELLAGVMRKLFRERNIRPDNDVFAYLVRRMERSVPVAVALVERLDEAAGVEHRPVSRALARQILEQDQLFEELLPDPLAPQDPSGENDD